MDYQAQANDFLKETKTRLSVKWMLYGKYFNDDKECRHIFRVTLKNSHCQYSFNFGQSIISDATPPTAYDILACVQKYDVGSFEDFCSGFGYDTDSRKAEKTYKAVCKEYAGISQLFSESEIMEKLQEIQ